MRLARLHGAAAALTVLMAGTAGAFAQEPICSGVGAEARAEAETADYTLKLVYAQQNGDFVADVHTEITDANGEVVVDVICGGPWVLVDLPGGSYDVSATFQGETETMTVAVAGDTKQEQVIAFAGAVQ